MIFLIKDKEVIGKIKAAESRFIRRKKIGRTKQQ